YMTLEERFEIWKEGTPKPTKELELKDFLSFVRSEIALRDQELIGKVRNMVEAVDKQVVEKKHESDETHTKFLIEKADSTLLSLVSGNLNAYQVVCKLLYQLQEDLKPDNFTDVSEVIKK